MTLVITPRRFSGAVRIPAPADFSLAAFAAAAAAISGGTVDLLGLDPEAENVFFFFLEKMGSKLRWDQIPLRQIPHECLSAERIPLGEDIIEELHPFGLHALGVQLPGLHFAEWQLTVSRNGSLVGGKFDLGDTPDLLPLFAAVACFAKGDTCLVYPASGRAAEIGNVTIIAKELRKLGVKISELSNELVIHGTGKIPKGEALSPNSSLKLDAHNDPMVFMALACAALGCPFPVEITGKEAALAAYQDFLKMLAGPD